MSTASCTQVTPECPVEATIYGYRPSPGANAFFTAWFLGFGAINLVNGVRYKTWTYMIALVLECICEGIGYIGRLIMHPNPWSAPGFRIQICCLIIGPVFNSAAVYLTLKHIALTFGPHYSFIKPRLYTYIFITGDILSLLLQAAGGGIAASSSTPTQASHGNDIMLAGVIWQVCTLSIFGILTSIYIFRRHAAARSIDPLPPQALRTLRDRKFKAFAFGVTTAFITIYIRCVYRVIEMASGWGNGVMRDQPSYIVLEGCMIAYATLVQTVIHPGYCFPQMVGPKPVHSPDHNAVELADHKGSLESED